jgi:hypothetical protein
MDSAYFSNRTFPTESKPIGSGTLFPHPNDSVIHLWRKNGSAAAH